MFQFTVSTIILVMVVLGGMGSIPGVAIGALMLTIFQSLMLGGLNTWAHALGNATGVAVLKTLDLTQANQLIYGVVLVADDAVPAPGAHSRAAVRRRAQHCRPDRPGRPGRLQANVHDRRAGSTR